jgi:hypothetical protein
MAAFTPPILAGLGMKPDRITLIGRQNYRLFRSEPKPRDDISLAYPHRCYYNGICLLRVLLDVMDCPPRVRASFCLISAFFLNYGLRPLLGRV